MMVDSDLAAEGFVEAPGILAPSGVYLLLRKGKVIYVGQSTNIYARLSTHCKTQRRKRQLAASTFTERDLRILTIPFDQAVIRFLPKDDLDRIEREYIHRFRPEFNIILPSLVPDVKIDVAALADKLGFAHWKSHLRESSQGLKRRQLA